MLNDQVYSRKVIQLVKEVNVFLKLVVRNEEKLSSSQIQCSYHNDRFSLCVPTLSNLEQSGAIEANVQSVEGEGGPFHSFGESNSAPSHSLPKCVRLGECDSLRRTSV